MKNKLNAQISEQNKSRGHRHVKNMGHAERCGLSAVAPIYLEVRHE